MYTQSLSRRKCLFSLGEGLATKDVFQLFSASPSQGQAPLLLPPYNHSWGAATAEWDPIIGAFVHNTEWARALWERGEGLERGRELAFREESGSKETSTTSVLPPPPDCSRRDGIHLNKPRNFSSTKQIEARCHFLCFFHKVYCADSSHSLNTGILIYTSKDLSQNKDKGKTRFYWLFCLSCSHNYQALFTLLNVQMAVHMFCTQSTLLCRFTL